MARSDSMIWFIVGFAQLILANQTGAEGLIGLLDFLLSLMGGSSIMVGLYVFLFMAKHTQDFSDAYRKYEKSELVRGDDGNLVIYDADSVVKKGVGVAVPAVITILSVIVWLATLN